MVAEGRVGNPVLYDPYKPGFQMLPGLPYFGIRDLVYSVEAGLVIVMGLELRPEHPGMYLLPLSRCPGWVMHTIGNVTDIQLLRKVSRIHPVEYFLADFSVEPGNSVHILGTVGRQETHREFLATILYIRLTETHHGLPVDLQALRVMTNVFPEKPLIECIVAGRNRSVGREQG